MPMTTLSHKIGSGKFISPKLGHLALLPRGWLRWYCAAQYSAMKPYPDPSYPHRQPKAEWALKMDKKHFSEHNLDNYFDIEGAFRFHWTGSGVFHLFSDGTQQHTEIVLFLSEVVVFPIQVRHPPSVSRHGHSGWLAGWQWALWIKVRLAMVQR